MAKPLADFMEAVEDLVANTIIAVDKDGYNNGLEAAARKCETVTGNSPLLAKRIRALKIEEN